MSFEWQNYLSLARELQTAEDDASLRTAVSRAYYAAFHAAREYVEAHIGPVPKRDSHEHVWNALASGHSSKPKAGSRGHGLKKRRCNADYDDVFLGLKTAAEKAVLDAEEIIGILSR